MDMLNLKRLILLIVYLLLMMRNATAGEVADVNARLEALQLQIQTLSAELRAMQEQLAHRSKAEDERSHSQISPTVGESEKAPLRAASIGEDKAEKNVQREKEEVYASFKDGLVFSDGKDNWSFQPNGRIQMDYRNITPTQWKNDTFSIRRARLGGTLTSHQDFTFRIEGEFANSNDGAKGTTALTYGYMDYNHFPGARLRIGQFKPVFGLERGESTNFIDFMELSLATANGPVFNSTYDRGLMLFGAPHKGVYYNLSYVNGSGQNNDSLKDSNDMIGRFTANVAELAEWKNTVAHFGVSASRNQVEPAASPAAGTVYSTALSAYTESNGITSNTSGNVGATATRFFSTDAFSSTSKVEKKRSGLEVALASGQAKLQGEYIATDFNQVAAVQKSINAWYTSLTWLVTGENYADAYKNGMFNRINPKQNFSLGSSGIGAIELGLRYSSFDASDFKTVAQGCKVGSGCLTSSTATAAYANKANAWTAGAKWILNPNARLMLNYVDTRFNAPVIINSKSSNDERAIDFRAQYDF